jgi:hypothetical protein
MKIPRRAIALTGADDEHVERRLRWSDFRVVTNAPPDAPDGAAAQTIAKFTLTGNNVVNVAPPGAGPMFTISDTLVMRVFLTSERWRVASVSQWPGNRQAWLIAHEQGRYDIPALLARDFFYRLRALIRVTFSDRNELQGKVADHGRKTTDRIQELNGLYEADTENSQNGSEQWAWHCAIERARQLHRTPLERGLDGHCLKLELPDALQSAGLG